MNSIVALPIAAAAPTVAPAMPTRTDPRTLHAYEPLIELAKEAIDAYQAFEACLSNLAAPERAMGEWERRNPKPTMDDFLDPGADKYGLNGTLEYEQWFAKWMDAETEEERAPLRLSDPNRYLKEAQRKYETAAPKWTARKKAASQQCGLDQAEAEDARLGAVFKAAAKRVRETRPISLGGIVAKARVAYLTEFDVNNHFAIINDIVKLFGHEENAVPDLFMA